MKKQYLSYPIETDPSQDSPHFPIALTIAGSDPTSGAGIQADLKTFAAHGVYGLSIITAITAQNTVGVQSVFPIPISVIVEQCESLVEDIPFKVLKTGMIYEGEAMEYIAHFISENNLIAVVDTPFISSSGKHLIEHQAQEVFIEKLLPAAEIITPNILEAEMLSGISIVSMQDVEDAATIILGRGAHAVLIKGGHLDGENSSDYFATDLQKVWLEAKKISGATVHGSGCMLSAAIAANLAKGSKLLTAVEQAKKFISIELMHSVAIGSGLKVFG
jgi:hydroxymethylpyrimidine/phosphomethylpyrimidine kinase